MFENSGKTIRSIANLIFGLTVIAGCILFIITMSNTSSILAALLTAGLVILGGYIQGLFLSAFGELVESNAEIQKSNKEILEKLEQHPQQ